MSDVIGKGVIEVSADTTTLQAGIEEGKRSIRSLGSAVKKAGSEAAQGVGGIGDEAPAAAAKVDRATKQMIASIQRATAVAEAGAPGTRAYFEAISRARGIDTAALKPYLDQLDTLSAKQVKTGVSAAQMSAALRGVPAQFTDIATSIAGGQAPLTVFLQQGGQLKDMFGGAGPAAKALGGYVLGLINPFTVAAAAAGVLAFAYKQGSDEADEYTKAIALSGNAAGVTREQLAGMAANVDKVIGTQASAAEALALLAGSGKVAGENLERFATVAQKIEKSVGIPIADTVKDLAELGRAPVEASEKLNQSYNYLTAATYAQIKAAADLGDTQKAAALAQSAYADALAQAADTVAAKQGTLQRGWSALKKDAADAWDAMLGIGREKTVDERIAELERLAAPGRGITNAPGEGMASNERTAAEDGELRMLKARKAAQDDAARAQAAALEKQAAGIAWQREGDKLLTKAEQTEKEIARVRTLGAKAGLDQVEVEKRVAAIRAKAAGENAPKDLSKSRLGFDINAIRQDGAALIGTYANIEKVIEANRAAGLVKESEYFAARRQLLQMTGQAEEAAAQAEIARLQKEVLTGKDKVENDQKIADAQAKLAKLRQDNSASAATLAAQETAASNKIRDAYRDATVAAEGYIAAVRRKNARDVAGIGKGDRFRSEQDALNAIEDRRTGRLSDLDRDRRNGSITDDQFKAYAELADKAYKDEVAAYRDRTDQIRALQGDWMTGFDEAAANYLANAENVVASTQAMFSGVFDGLTNGIASSLSRAIVYGEDLGESLRNVALGVADAFIAAFIKIQIQRMFIDKTAAAAYASTLTLQGQAMANMAALNAFASTAAIPIVGPGLAPGAASAALAFAETFAGAAAAAASASVASARGGFDVPAGVNPLTQLHEREMVLPAVHADVIRDLARGGSRGGGPITIVNNTSAKIGRVREQDTGGGGRALVLEEAVAAVAGQLGDPNSRLSRAMSRNFNLQRNR